MWARGPLLSVLVVLLSLLLTDSAPRGDRKTCDVGGKTFSDGDRLKTADPCLECQCSGGRVDCRLRVCPKLPRPPPPSCFLLERPRSCCATMLCPKGPNIKEQARANIEPTLSAEHQEGCSFNGTVYAEGSAMVTSSSCEYCYCIRGKQHCVKPKCVLTVPGCRPEYAGHSCCPITYVCSEKKAPTNSTLISASSTSSPPGSCSVGGQSYPEGDRMTGLESPCEICVCLKGKATCKPVICDLPPPAHCSPVLSPGHCCPLSYNCSSNEEATTPEIELESKEIANGAQTTLVDTTTLSVTMTTASSTETEATTTTEMAEITSKEPNESEERFAASGIEALSDTTEMTLEDTTTTRSILEVRNSSGKVKVSPDVIEAILNRTLEKDQDYEYDYNEPSLPPSLPNLKIIPFVAADAVLHENEEDPLYAETNHKTPIYTDSFRTAEPVYNPQAAASMFSPPAETEGGFMPKDPSLDDPFFIAGIKPDLMLSGITESTKKIIKDDEETKISHMPHLSENATPNNYGSDSLSNLLAITVADGVVTPNPFKDVIRTEQPPDLEDIMKDRPIHTTTTAPRITSTAPTTGASPTVPHPGIVSAASTTTLDTSTMQKTRTSTTTLKPPKSQNNSTDYDYGDNLSFSSVLDFLFSGGSSETSSTTEKVVKEVTTDSTPFESYNAESNVIVHKEAQDRSDVNVTDDLDDSNNVFTPEKDVLLKPSALKSPPNDPISGLLKLAGCNIYGRIYRVDRIIEELSNPCFECLCTVLGVQCKKLEC